MRFDMPGCGESEGERGNLICLEQVAAASDALTSLLQHKQIEPDRIGMVGSSFGAAVAVYCGGVDKRVAAVISSGGWGDGERKFRGQHPSAGGLEEIHRHAGGGQAASRAHRAVADGAALRHRPDPAAPARPSCAKLDPDVHGRDRAEHVRFPRRRRDRPDCAAAGAAAAQLGRFGDADRTVDRTVQARRAAVRSAPVRGDRSFHVRGKQHPRPQRDLRLAGEVFPGPCPRCRLPDAHARNWTYSGGRDGRVHPRCLGGRRPAGSGRRHRGEGDDRGGRHRL